VTENQVHILDPPSLIVLSMLASISKIWRGRDECIGIYDNLMNENIHAEFILNDAGRSVYRNRLSRQA